jgi:hypothetical protein
MNYYLCIGLGIWLMAKTVDYENPLLDMPPWKEIGMFLGVLFLWPLALVGNALHSHEGRKLMIEDLAAFEAEVLRVKAQLDALDDVESNDRDKDEGEGT